MKGIIQRGDFKHAKALLDRTSGPDKPLSARNQRRLTVKTERKKGSRKWLTEQKV